MSFASDQLYNGYLRRNMPTMVTTVKVREIVVHLPCLTAHDRETIEAKREICGNYDAMSLLLDCLKRRDNWPEQFIAALEACEHRMIAADIRKEYDALRGVNNTTPSSPPTTVVQAHVHPAPPTGHMSLPKNAANAQAAGPSPPVQPLPSQEVQPQAPQIPVAPVDQAAMALAPVVQAQMVQTPVVQAPVILAPVAPAVQAAAVQTPPLPPEPSPEPPQVAPLFTPPPPATPPSAPPQTEVNAHQEPEQDSESDLQGDENLVNAVENHVSTPQSPPAEQHQSAQPSGTTSAMDRRSPSPPMTDPDLTDGSPLLQHTPEKAPVQETTPPVDRVPLVVLEPQETSDPLATPVIELSPQTMPTAPASALPAGMDTSACDEDDVCLSKPGDLISVQPQNNGDATVPASTVEVQEPYSGNTDRLEISITMTSGCSTAVNTPSVPPCQENGIAHNEPEEDHYESSTQSLNQVMVNEFHFAEESSVENLDGQTAAPQPQIVNGETAKAVPPVLPTIIINAAENHHPPELMTDPKTLQDWEEKPPPRAPSSNMKYILTAAGVGACALMVAWRLKN